MRKTILLLPLVGILLIGLLVLRRSGPAPEHLRLIAQSELSRVLGREVSIGRVSRGLLKRAVLHDVRIGPAPQGQAGPLLRAPSVAVDYRLGDLLTGRVDAAGSIGRIVVNRPTLVVERSQAGVWSIADLIERPRPAKPVKFRGRIVVRDGQVTFTDAAAPGGRVVLHLRRVRGDIDFGRPPQVQVALSCRGDDGRFGRLRLVGGFDTARRRLQGNLDLVGLDAGACNHYLPRAAPVRITSGTVDAQAAATMALDGERHWSAQVALDRVAGAVAPLGQRAVLSGRVRVMDEVVRLDQVQVESAATSLRVSGVVAGFRDPKLDLTLEGTSAQPLALLPPGVRKALGERLALEGPVAARLRVVGPASKPAATGEIALASVTAYGIRAAQPTAHLSYREGQIWIDDLHAEVADGQVGGKVWLAAGDEGPRAVIRAELMGVRAEQITRALGVEPVSGRVSGQVAASLAGGRPEAVGRLTLASGSVRGIAIGRAEVLARYADGVVTVSEGTVDTPFARLAASGEADLRPRSAAGVDMEVSLEGFDLAALGMLAGRSDLAGTASARGRVSGPLASPRFEGRITAADLALGGLRAEAFEAEVAVAREGLRLNRATLYQGGGRIAASGDVTGPDFARAEIAARVEAHSLDLAGLLGAAGLEPPVKGRVSGRFEVEGRLPRPRVSGAVEVAALEAAGVTLGSARAEMGYADGVVTLSRGGLSVNGSTVEVSGSAAVEAGRSELDLAVSATDFDLSALSVDYLERAGIRLAGSINLNAQVMGTRQQIAGAGSVRDCQVALNGVRLRNLTAAGKWSGGQAEVERLRFDLGKGAYAAHGTFDPQAGRLSAAFETSDGDLGALRAAAGALSGMPGAVGKAARMAMRVPAPFGGVLKAQGQLAGQASAPEGAVSFEADGIVVGGRPAPSVSGAVGFAGTRLTVERFVAKAEEAYATAQGTVDLAGDMHLDVDAYNISAQTIESLARVKQPLAGLADVSLVVSGPTHSPHAIATATVSQAGIGALALGDVMVSRCEVSQDAIAVDGLALALNGGQLSAGGKAAFAWSAPHLPPDGPLDISASLGPGLNLVAALMPDFVPQAKGYLTGEVRLGGTWARPEYDGRVRVKEGEMTLGDFAQSEVEASLRITTAQGETPRHVLSGRIAVRPVFGIPSVQARPVEERKRLPGLLDPDLDVEVVIEEGTRLNTAAVGMWLTGEGKIGGSASAPTVRVSMESRRGWLQFPAARFRLIYAAVDLVRPAPSAEQPAPRMRLPINADYEGTATRYEATGAPRSYEVAMRLSGDLLDPDRAPDVQLRSVPDLPEGEIYAMITGFGSIMGALREGTIGALMGSQVRDFFTAGYAPSQLQPFEQQIAKALRLEDFGIDLSTLTLGQPLRLRMGKALSKRLYATYSRAVAGRDPSDQLRVTLELTPSWSLGWTYESQALRSTTPVTEGRRRTRVEIRKTFRF